MVGVAQGLAGNIPGPVPIIKMLIHQEAHQLRHGNGRMSIIELALEVFKEIIQAVVDKQVDTDHVLQGAGHEKILLFQPQLFPLELFVIGVEDLGDGFGINFVFHCAVVVTGIEVFKVKGGVRLRAPQPEQVNIVDLKAGNRCVVGNSGDHPGRNPAYPSVALFPMVHFSMAAETDITGHVRFLDLPGIAGMQPTVTDFLLPAINNLLVEHAELVADTIADGRDLQRGE